jgi:hypothetical protein
MTREEAIKEVQKMGLVPCYYPAESKWLIHTGSPNWILLTPLFNELESALLHLKQQRKESTP